MKRGKPKNGLPIFVALWLVGWTFGVGYLDLRFGTTAAVQLRALRFPTSPGIVADSRVRTIHNNNGVGYGVELTYRFSVGGVEYEGHRWRSDSSFSKAAAEEAVDASKPGATVTVHYNPADPTDSMLCPGLGTGDAFNLLFATPFNLAWLCMLGYVLASSGFWLGPFTQTEEGTPRWKLHSHNLPANLLPPIAEAMVAICLAAILGMFVLVIGDLRPSTVATVWYVVLAFGLLTWANARRRLHAARRAYKKMYPASS